MRHLAMSPAAIHEGTSTASVATLTKAARTFICTARSHIEWGWSRRQW